MRSFQRVKGPARQAGPTWLSLAQLLEPLVKRPDIFRRDDRVLDVDAIVRVHLERLQIFLLVNGRQDLDRLVAEVEGILGDTADNLAREDAVHRLEVLVKGDDLRLL